MLRTSVWAIVLVVASTGMASAEAISLSVGGTHALVANSADEKVDVFVSGGQPITGVQLYAYIGDGDLVLNEPQFAGPVTLEGTIWSGGGAPAIGGPGPQTAGVFAPQLLDNSITLASGQVAANGKIATLHIDTRGFSVGASFPLVLTWEPYGGTPSDLIGPGHATGYGATLANGTIQLVPEPGTLVMLLGGVAVLAARFTLRRRRLR